MKPSMETPLEAWLPPQAPRLNLPDDLKVNPAVQQRFDRQREVMSKLVADENRSISDKLLGAAGAALQWKLKAGRRKDVPSSGKLPPLNKGLLNVGSLTGSAPDVRLVISQGDLERFGVPGDTMDRVYRMVEIYTLGFQNLLSELLATANDPAPLISRIWTTFLLQAEEKYNVAFSSDLSKLLRHMEGKHAEMYASVMKAADDLQRSTAMNDLMQKSLVEARSALSDESENRKGLEERLALQAGNISDLEKKLVDVESKKQYAEDEIAELAFLPVKMSEFSRRMWEVTDTSENLKSSLQRSERERTTLSNDLCKTKARLEEECGTSSAQRTELHTLRVDHSEMKERTAMMERDLLVTRRELALKNKDAQAAVALRIQVEKSEEEKREANQKLQEQLRKSEDEKVKTKREVQVLRVLRADLQSKLELEREKIEGMQEELEKGREAIRKQALGTSQSQKLAQRKLDIALKENANLKDDLAKVKGELQQTAETLEATKLEFEACKRDLEGEVVILDKKLKKQERQSANALAIKQELIEKAQGQVNSLNKRMKEEQEKFRMHMQTAENDIAALTAEKEGLEETIVQKDKEKEEVLALNDFLKRDVSHLKEKIQTIEKEVASSDKEKVLLKAKIQELEGNLQIVAQKEASLRDQIAEGSKNKQALEGQMADWKAKISDLEHKLEKREAEFMEKEKKLEAEMEEVKESLATAEATLNMQSNTLVDSLGGVDRLIPKVPRSPRSPRSPNKADLARIAELEKKLRQAEETARMGDEAKREAEKKVRDAAIQEEELRLRLAEKQQEVLDGQRLLEDEAKKKADEVDFVVKQQQAVIQQEVEALLPNWWGSHDDSDRPGTPLGTISLEDISSNEELLKKVEEAIEEAAAEEEKPPQSTVVAGREMVLLRLADYPADAPVSGEEGETLLANMEALLIEDEESDMFEKSQELRVAIERIRITIAEGGPLPAEMLEQCSALVTSLGQPEEETGGEQLVPELTQEAVEKKQKAAEARRKSAEEKKGLLKGLIGKWKQRDQEREEKMQVIEAERMENLKKIEDTHTVSQEEKEIQEELAKQQQELDRLKKDLDAKSAEAEKVQELAQGLSETIEKAAPLTMEPSGDQMEAEENLVNMLVSQVMTSARERGINIPQWQAEAVKFQVERAMANSRQQTRSTGSAHPRPLTGTRPRTGNRPLTGTNRAGTPLSRTSTPMVGGAEVHFPGAMQGVVGFQTAMEMEKDGQGFYRMQIPEGAGVWKVTSNRELIVHSVSDGFDGVWVPPLDAEEREDTGAIPYTDEGPPGMSQRLFLRRLSKEKKKRRGVQGEISQAMRDCGFLEWHMAHNMIIKKELRPFLHDLNSANDHIEYDRLQKLPKHLVKVLIKSLKLKSKMGSTARF
jgi:chromosome segregation ATPase